jgi:hypothetical protein
LETCRSVGDLAAEAVVAAECSLDRHEAARIAEFSVIEAGLAMP